MTIITEISNFDRFSTPDKFAAYLGLRPGDHSSGESTVGLGITKTGNSLCRRLLIEACNGIGKGKVGHISKKLKAKQNECHNAKVIAYANKANTRLRSRFYYLTLKQKKAHNVAKVAIARELACFIWGIMTGTY